MTRSILIVLALISLLPSSAFAQSTEREYQDLLCADLVTSRYLPNGTEVDCISSTHAIEVDFTNKWAEAIGQSLMYASELELRPGIILVCHPNTRDELCLNHSYLIEQTVTYWRIGMTVWYCGSDARRLTDCTETDLMSP